MPDSEKATKSPNVVELTIQGMSFSYDAPYKEGDTLDAVEAAAINGLHGENVRNNFAGIIKKMKADIAKERGLTKKVDGKDVPDIDEVSNDDLDADTVNEAFAGYVEQYEFGARRAGGIRAPADPVERETRRVATEQVKALITRKQIKISSVSKEKMAELVDSLLASEAGATIRENAKQFVEANKGLNLAALDI